MRSSVHHRRSSSSGVELSPLVMIAAASFLAGFGAFLLVGLNTLH
jgi:hypothetical protein